MERRNFSVSRGLLYVAIGVLIMLSGLKTYQFGVGLARHGGDLVAYWEAQEKSSNLQEALDLIHDYYVDGDKVEMEDLTDRALEAIVSDLDPYSEYLSPRKLEDLRADTNQEFGGIGIRVEMKDHRLTVVAPMPGTPGAKAGLLRGDQITAVDGESIEGVSFRESIGYLRGKAGSQVLLTIYRPRDEESFDAEIIRELIGVDNVTSAKVLEDRIGYLRILQFGVRTGVEMVDKIEELRADGIDALIVDLRGNPGGLLDVAVEVAAPFLEKGQLVVYTEGRQRYQNESWEVKAQQQAYDFPLVLLVNGSSASASEIVAGALKDWERATLVGEKTFGKGSVQSIMQLGDNAGLRLTTAKYYTPGGYVIHGNGIEPDVTVELSDDEIEKLAKQHYGLEFMTLEEFVEEFDFEPIADRQLDAALEVLRGNLQVDAVEK